MARFISWRKLFGRLAAPASSRKASVRKPIRLALEQLETRLTPSTTLSIADNSVLEPSPMGTVNLDFTVTRSGDLISQITVGYTTVAGTAQPGTDFTPKTGTVFFASGAATATISIPVFGNGIYNNPSLTFSVKLTGILNVVGPPVTLANQVTFAVGSRPFSVAVGDLNGDGKPDLVVANEFDDTVSVLLNTTAPGATTPSFATQQTFATGSGPFSVALGDVNGDGKPDIIVANANDATVSVLLNMTAPGAATASFAAPQTFDTGNEPSSVAVGDLNGDCKPDLVVANTIDGTVSVLLNMTAPGAATPSFATQQTFATGNGPVSVALGDLNGDGKPDLVVANDNSPGTLSVLLNMTAPGAATPSFTTQQTFAIGNSPDSVAVGDVNGDGKPDLVATNSGDATVSVLPNTTAPGAATASFATQQTFATGGAVAVVLGDLNGDGKPDLVVGNAGDDTVSVLVNTTMPGATTASFATQQTFATGNALAVALGDINGDGKPDVIVANFFNGPSTVSVLLNTTVLGAATITPAFPQAATLAVGTNPVSVAVGDVNGDGKPDLVVTNQSNHTVSVLLNTTALGTTTPSFASPQTFATGNEPTSVALGDLNGDGRPDLVVSNQMDNTVSVLLNMTAPGATTASFGTQQTFAVGKAPIGVALGDLNGDGKLDLVVTDEMAATVSVLLNMTAPGATTASFATQQTFATGNTPVSVAVGDLNGDGKPDLVVANANDQTVSVLLNMTAPGATTASFATQQNFAVVPEPLSVALGDVNGDGKPDLVVVNGSANIGSVSVLLNTTLPGATSASFATQQTFATGRQPESVALGDVNGDGKPDLIVTNSIDSTVSVFLNTTPPGATTPSFATQQTFATGSGPQAVALGDVNGDGRPDLVVANMPDATVSVLLNTPVTIIRAQATGTINESDSPPTVQFNVAGEVVNENAGTFSITVSQSVISGAATTIPFTLGGTAVAVTDYSGVTASPLVIPAGQTSGTITGTLPDDWVYGGPPNETLTFTLGTLTNATLGSVTTNTLTINEISIRPGFPGLTAQERFVQALYLDELNRAGAQSELDTWVAILNSPSGSQAAVASAILHSSEARDRLVKSWYALFLGRQAMGGEEQIWVNVLLQGSAEETVLSFILGSAESYGRAQTLIPTGTPHERFVQALYQLLLHRTASPGEVDGWVNDLPRIGRQGVALAFLLTTEFRTNLFEEYYQDLLHRQADPGGLNAWVFSGQDASPVRQNFESTPEFFNSG